MGDSGRGPDLRAAPSGTRRFEGLAERYAAGRPRLPWAVGELCCQLARVERPTCVVDLGSGTGASLVLWSGRADRVVGIEPSPDMLRAAAAACAALPDAERFELRPTVAVATGLPDHCAEIVTCSQALHWLEPTATFTEVARLLRPGGVFCAVDCDWPPLVDWELDPIYRAVFAHLEARERELGLRPSSWEKGGHLGRMRAAGCFRWTAELEIGHPEQGDAERVLRLVESQGAVAALRRAGCTDRDLRLDHLAAEARRILGDRPQRWWWTYRLRVGVA